MAADGEVHPFREHHGQGFADFLTEAHLDEIALTQREIYEDDEKNKYGSSHQADANFVRNFVTVYLRGDARNKDYVLFEALKALRLNETSKVLEIGCNDGRYLNVTCSLHRCGGVGVDLAEAAVRRAIDSKVEGLPLEFHVAEASRLPFADGSFDAIISFDVFEHLGHEGVQSTIRECSRVLKPGGQLLIYVISRKDRFTWHDTIRRVSLGALGHDNQEGHSYENFLLPDEFRSYAARAGLIVRWTRAYHGFWTLFVEEHLAMGGALPQWCYRYLSLLDYPVTRTEHGNGFFALAEAP